jgi:hypothetical protein
MEWIAFLLHIQEFKGSNLSPKISYLNRRFVVFLSPSRQMPGYHLKLGCDHFLPHPFQFINHPII